MVYIANQWTARSPTTVRVYSNCEQVSLYLNDRLVATQSPDKGTSLLHPPFNFAVGSFVSGTLRADGLIGGAVKVSTTRMTPGSATAIPLRPEATTLLADASDARLVFVDVVDGNGTVVPTDTSTLAVAVSAAGSIVGSTSTVLQGGQLAVWVRSTRTPGTITLTASGTGLAQASVDLTSQAVPGVPPLPAGR
jgi:beta-galactosidase